MKTAHHPAHRTAHHNGNDSAFASELETLRDSFTQLRSDVTQLIQNAVHTGQSGVVAVQDGAGKAVDSITGTVTDTLSDLKKQSMQSVKAVKKQIGAYPITTAAIALGAGFILAKFFSRK
jgi:ElaB/YqjD/DUF883 family membrane-anchored ribosome-binding protein